MQNEAKNHIEIRHFSSAFEKKTKD